MDLCNSLINAMQWREAFFDELQMKMRIENEMESVPHFVRERLMRACRAHEEQHEEHMKRIKTLNRD